MNTNNKSNIVRSPSLASLALCASLLVLTACTEDPSNDASASPTTATADGAPEATPSVADPSENVEAPAPEGEVDVVELMSDQPLPDIVIGQEDAPVTIVEYASMTCDHCAAFHANTYPTLKRDYIDTGKAKLIIREFPFDPRATAAFMLARCTPNDGRTAMIDVLFSQSEKWAHSEEASTKLLSLSRLAGMSEEGFRACLADTDLQAKVGATMERGQSFGVNSTPTFFVNGKKYVGALPLEQMAAIVGDAVESAPAAQ